MEWESASREIRHDFSITVTRGSVGTNSDWQTSRKTWSIRLTWQINLCTYQLWSIFQDEVRSDSRCKMGVQSWLWHLAKRRQDRVQVFLFWWRWWCLTHAISMRREGCHRSLASFSLETWSNNQTFLCVSHDRSFPRPVNWNTKQPLVIRHHMIYKPVFVRKMAAKSSSSNYRQIVRRKQTYRVCLRV